jgi:hypothetical protein
MTSMLVWGLRQRMGVKTTGVGLVAAALCPLHGPIVRQSVAELVRKYRSGGHPLPSLLHGPAYMFEHSTAHIVCLLVCQMCCTHFFSIGHILERADRHRCCIRL